VAPKTATFSFALNRDKLRKARRREGRYLLRTNLCDEDPAKLWKFYIQLVEVGAAFKNLKDDKRELPSRSAPSRQGDVSFDRPTRMI
jgi:hypothetical protein